MANKTKVRFSTCNPDVYRYPFKAYPNGWFPIALSNEIAAGYVKTVFRMGLDLVVYRTESGKANVVGAYCPHMAANIGYGGTVSGELLQCPFHHWKFGVDGACTEIAGTDYLPKKAIATFPSREINGAIFMWYDDQNREPSWHLPDIYETRSLSYQLVATKTYDVACHPQEAFENQPDSLHFKTLHGWDDIELEWECDFESTSTELEISVSGAKEDSGATDGIDVIKTVSVGPSCNYTKVKGDIDGLAILQFCPTLPGRMYNPVSFYVHKSVEKDIAQRWVASYLEEYEKDLMIWEKKQYRSNPELTDADGDIKTIRKWYSKWYL